MGRPKFRWNDSILKDKKEKSLSEQDGQDRKRWRRSTRNNDLIQKWIKAKGKKKTSGAPRMIPIHPKNVLGPSLDEPHYTRDSQHILTPWRKLTNKLSILEASPASSNLSEQPASSKHYSHIAHPSQPLPQTPQRILINPLHYTNSKLVLQTCNLQSLGSSVSSQ